MSTLAVPSTSSHELSRSDSVASSVVSHVSTNSFLPVINQEDLFSASFVLSAVAEASNRAGEAAPRAPYLRPVSTFNSPALSPSSAGMRSSDTLVRVDTHSSSATTPVPPLPPTRPLAISHQRRSIRSRLSLSRATPAVEPQVEPVKTKRAFSLPFNMPSHSTLSLATSSIMSNELPNLLDDAGKHGTATTPPAADSSWVPPPPPVAQGQSEAPVKGKGGPGWYGGKRINDRGEVVQVGADGVETVIMKLPQKAAPIHPSAAASASSTPALPPVHEHIHAHTSRKHSASSTASGSSDASSTSSLFDSYSEGSSRSSFSSGKSSSGDHKDDGIKPERPHRHRSAKILSTLKAQHSAEKLALSTALDESKQAVESLKAENGQLRDECRELRMLVLDIRRVIQGDAFIGLGLANTGAAPSASRRQLSSSSSSASSSRGGSSLLPPALIRSSRSDSSSSGSSTEDYTRLPREQKTAAPSAPTEADRSFGGGVGRQWFDEEASSDEDDDVRDLIAAFPSSPTSVPASSPPPTAALPPTPSFGFKAAKVAQQQQTTPTKGHKQSASLSSFSRIPMLPRSTKRPESAPKLVIGAPQGFRSL